MAAGTKLNKAWEVAKVMGTCASAAALVGAVATVGPAATIATGVSHIGAAVDLIPGIDL